MCGDFTRDGCFPCLGQASGLWVRVCYRGKEDGWILTANKRGAILTPAGGNPADAARDFQDQEASYAAAAAAAAAADASPPDEDERPLTGAKHEQGLGSSGVEASGGTGGGSGGGGVSAEASASPAAQSSSVAGGGRGQGAASSPEYMKALG